MKFSQPSRAYPFSSMLAWVAGVMAAQQFYSLPPPWVILLAGAASSVLWFIRLRVPAIFLLGLAWSLGFAAIRLNDALPAELERREIVVEGRVIDVPSALDQGLRFDFRVEKVLEPKGGKVPELIRLGWYEHAQGVKAGEHWRFSVRLKRPHGFFNPGGLDYELWLFSRGIRATGYIAGSTEKLAGSSPYSMPALRQSLYDRLARILAGSEMAGNIIALAMGEESAISPGQWDVWRRTGTAHLVAISGSHISLVAGLVYWLVRRLFSGLGIMRWPPQSLAAAFAFIAAFFYSALTDFAVPTQRALIMIFIVMAGIISQRNVRPLPTLALALLAVTLYEPPAVLAAGFWLSFGAVGLILLVVAGRLRPSGWWMDLWRINLATSLGLSPLLLFFFQQVSLVSPLANLLAVPTIGLLLTPLCLAGALLLYLAPPMGEALLHLVEFLLHGVWVALQWLSELDWAQWNHPAPPSWTLSLALFAILLLLAPRGVPARWLGLVLLVPSMAYRPPAPAEGDFRLELLDVGQALSAVVQTREHCLVFDTGVRLSPSFDTGSAVVEPYLRHQGIESIDVLLVSHGDNDHIGGADSLLRRFQVKKIYSSVPDQLPKSLSEPCNAGQSWQWDGVRFDMLSPFGAVSNDNNHSCVLRVSSAKGSVVLTGDIEKPAEELLAERYGEGLKSDILIAPHHGSNTSSSPEFLATVRPEYVLVPAGYLNRYNFPHPQVLRRYREAGAKVFDTATSGAVSVEPGGIPKSYRQTDGRYWNAKPTE